MWVFTMLADVVIEPNISSSMAQQTSINVSWTQPDNTCSQYVAYYTVQCSPAGTTTIRTDTINTTDTNTTIQQLWPDTNYTCHVTAWSDDGDSSQAVPFFTRTLPGMFPHTPYPLALEPALCKT